MAADTNADNRSYGTALAIHLWVLTKPRLSLLSVLTVLVGYLAALPEHSWPVFMALLLGAALAAGGCAALNQGLEGRADALMTRTRQRPVPLGAITAYTACGYGAVLCITGDLVLALWANSHAAFFAILIQVIYIYPYTTLKRRTPWNTEVGAVPGALPPLMGWAAAQAQNWGLAWILFGILFTWQMPHFMALAQQYRKDYARAGFKMLSVTEPTGRAAGRKALGYTMLLLAFSLLPGFLGYTTAMYTAIALILGLLFLVKAITFASQPCDDQKAQKLFLNSIIYLPLLLAALTLDRCLL